MVGGGAAQVIAKDADVDPPAGTVTLCDVLEAEQLLANPVIATVWLPEARSLKVTLPLSLMASALPPSTLTL